MRHGNMKSKMYDFEACDQRLGEKFLIILKIFHISPAEYSIDPLSGSWVKFYTSEKSRIQLEYVFCRFVGFNRPVESDGIYKGDIYAIY